MGRPRCALAFAWSVLLCPASAVAASVGGPPVASVIELLQELGAKAKEEGKAEAVLYTKFEYWCMNSARTLTKAIDAEKSKVARLQDQIASLGKSAEVLSAEIDQLQKEIQDLDAQDAEATDARSGAQALYEEQSSAHSETIKAISDAIAILEQSKADTATLLGSRQRVSRVVALLGEAGASEEERRRLAAFASGEYEPKERPELKASGDQESHVKRYSFKSHSVIELLKELQLKFEDEFTAMNTEETNAVNAHQLSAKARKQLRTARDDSRTEKVQILGQTQQDLNQAGQDLSDTQADLRADTETFGSTKKACELKKSEWMERSEVRANEIKAIEKAVEILAKVTGVRTEPPTNPGIPPSPVEAPPAFVQLSSPKVQRAIDLLRKEAKVAHSSLMDQIATQLAAKKDGPFDQVVNSIQKMIFHLQHEQKQEDDHKNWCDLELSKTDASLADKQAKLEELAVKIEGHDATSIELQEDIQEADKMVAAIDAHMKEATEIRRIGHMENAAAIKDAQDAQVAIANAISVLKDFYKSSGAIQKEAYELVQRSAAPVNLPETPSTWDSSYTSVADPAAQPEGIVTVLETVSADFSRMESDTKAQEETDQQAFDEDIKACNIEKARRNKESQMKASERKRVVEKKAAMQARHKSVASEHEATAQYLKDLQPACVEGDSSYEERKAARALEIEALTQVQGILQEAFAEHSKDTAPSFLQKYRLRGALA